MWLLNTTTLDLESFSDNDLPPYAILSHTWGPPSEEVTFVEMQGPRERLARKEGFVKINDFCRLASQRGYKYGWVDTCCIDKRNSADLSEAINSMYRYYYESGECLVYLSDTIPLDDWRDPLIDWGDLSNAELADALGSCRWFTRGWTLQELVAPTVRSFFDVEWRPIMNRHLLVVLSAITGIGDACLLFRDNVHKVSISERMSWASRRQTTRSEDVAYSLMGIFNICMPVLYGEGGKKAFRRLQKEIMRVSFDQSLFVWKEALPSSGFLASSPAAFENSPKLGLWAPRNLAPFYMTNVGLSVRLNVVEILPKDRVWIPENILRMYDASDEEVKVHLAIIGCDVLNSDNEWVVLALYVQPVPGGSFVINGKISKAYRRVACDTWTAVPKGVLFQRSGPSRSVDVLILEDEHFELVRRASREHDERSWDRLGRS
ncbi:heterokaryon incompatibility protein-domain-containing protein [Triangularia verruculosa]|uniref:Heterokaryon incompatibility protein-domain-containing protein n=1 Tax=Triangularia verruculosa TaxID=2587418 RepID=A0AAN6XR88_9PEZI|nr:heterokaryon incompatibility protein-domain-containing protein [Triangularia verruculosa]